MRDPRSLARAISAAENDPTAAQAALAELGARLGRAHVIGITGPPGAGKSTLTGRLAVQLLARGFSLGLILVDPSSPFTGGALLGDRLRLPEVAGHPNAFVRSMSSRGSMGGLSRATSDTIKLMDAYGKDIILVETVGTGQAETDIVMVADSVLVVAVPGLGDEIQALKAGILEIADLFVVNKADREGAERTERELRSMLKMQPDEGKSWEVPVLKAIATKDQGVPELVDALLEHQDYLSKSGELGQRRQRRVRKELDELLQVKLRHQLQEVLTPAELNITIESIVKGEQTVYTAADYLWSCFMQKKEGRI